VRVVMDPASPMDIDQAHLFAMEIASDSGLKADGVRRWECWCARPGEEQHFQIEEGEEGAPARITRDEGGPLVRPDGTAMVPVVFFTAHTEELGLFTAEGSDLIPVNRGLNVLVTDIHHIAEAQGFGVLVITTAQGSTAPAEIVRAPNRAISLPDGVTAEMLNANAPIGDLLELADRRIKQAAVLYGIPAGSVSLEARAAASGIALQIENRPLLEMRADAVEVYRDPMRRIWDLIRAHVDAYADDAPDLDDVEMRWTPGDVQVPVDDAQKVDDVLAKMKARLCTRAEAIAELRGISIEEAKKVMVEIDAERAAEPSGMPEEEDPLGLAAKRRGLEEEEPEEEPEPEE
jgi:hypothetical protein